MQLLAPSGLFALGLLAPLIALYVLKVRRRRVTVASTWLWASAQRDLLAKSPWRKLLLRTSLLLQLLALGLLALALARPATSTSDLVSGRVAIIIDASASMSALARPDDAAQGTRFESARAEALALVRALPKGSEAMVIEAGSEPRIVSPLDRDMTHVAAAIESVQVREVEGDIEQAVALAVDRLHGPGARIVIVTDGYLATPPALLQVALPIAVRLVGEHVDNVAIVRSDVRLGRDANARDELQVFVVAQSFATLARDTYVTVRREGETEVLDSRRVHIEPGEALPVELSFRARPSDYGAGLVFEISPHDAMPVDDITYGRVPPKPLLPVVLAGSDRETASPWLARALRSDPGIELSIASAAELPTRPTAPGSLVIADGFCPDAATPGGDLLVVHPPPGRCFELTVGDAVEAPAITSWEPGDPRLRFLTLDGVTIAKGNLLSHADPRASLVRSQHGTLVADGGATARTVTVVGFDVGDSDWPLKASFVLFARNVAELARTHRASGVVLAARTGEALRVAVPGGVTTVSAVDQQGTALDASLAGGIVVVPETAKAGLYRVRYDGPAEGTIVVPVNLSSARESDLRARLEWPDSGNVEVQGAGAPQQRSRELGWLLALLALALVLLEVTHHTRQRRSALPTSPRAPDRKAS